MSTFVMSGGGKEVMNLNSVLGRRPRLAGTAVTAVPYVVGGTKFVFSQYIRARAELHTTGTRLVGAYLDDRGVGDVHARFRKQLRSTRAVPRRAVTKQRLNRLAGLADLLWEEYEPGDTHLAPDRAVLLKQFRSTLTALVES
jgi:hypothetical protein